MRVVATHGYDRRARKLLTPQERTTAELEIAVAPMLWPVIAGTGGARIIYYVVTRRGVLYLIDIYAKSDKEDLTDAEKHEIRTLVATLEADA